MDGEIESVSARSFIVDGTLREDAGCHARITGIDSTSLRHGIISMLFARSGGISLHRGGDHNAGFTVNLSSCRPLSAVIKARGRAALL